MIDYKEILKNDLDLDLCVCPHLSEPQVGSNISTHDGDSIRGIKYKFVLNKATCKIGMFYSSSSS